MEFIATSKVNSATIRCSASENIAVYINDTPISLEQNGDYKIGNLAQIKWLKNNTIRVESENPELQFIADIAIFLQN